MNINYNIAEKHATVKGNIPDEETLHVCITTAREFAFKSAYIFKEINQETKVDIGRLYKPRKLLTEMMNGIPTQASIPEPIVFFDFYIQKLVKPRDTQFDDLNFPGDGIFPISYDMADIKDKKLTRSKVPKVGEVITFFNRNVHKSDHISPREFQGTIASVYPYIHRYDTETGKYIQLYSRSFGVVGVEIDLANYKLKRSLVIPPLIPLHVPVNLSIR